jgi:undecaprenyl-phosphate 4-deoxy-4-formamido-L-arabinose transferase
MSKVSIVIPVYRGARTIGPLVERLEQHLGGVHDLEIVLVNDGSPDDSGAVCRQLAAARPRVRFVNLSRNFGEHNAVMAGLNHCAGDVAVIMDDDFQNPPSEVSKLVAAVEAGHDVAFACYERKQHSWFRNFGSRFNDRVASVMLGKPRDLYLASFKAINRWLIEEVIRYEGPYPYLDGLILRATRDYVTVAVQHDARQEGRSGYTVRKLVALWLNMFTNFSILPLRIAAIAGIVVGCLGVASAIVFLVEKLRDPSLPAGWASLIVSLMLLSGIQLFALGMIGEYLGRLFLKDVGRPQFVVRDAVNCAPRRPGDGSRGAAGAEEERARVLR